MTVFPCFNAWVIFHHEWVSHALIDSSLHPYILSLLSSLGIGNAAAFHALEHVVFKIRIFLKHPRSREALSYFLSLFSIKACGQWSSYWLLPLMCVCVLVAQSCPTLCNPTNCSLPGTSVHRILQAKILEWVFMPFSPPNDMPPLI